jgi:hypothetical protein
MNLGALMSSNARIAGRLAGAVVLLVAAAMAWAASASAAPVLTVTNTPKYTNLQRGDEGAEFTVVVRNTNPAGGDATSGPLTLTLDTPAGFKFARVNSAGGFTCETGAPVVCTRSTVLNANAMATFRFMGEVTAEAADEITLRAIVSGGGIVAPVSADAVLSIVDRPPFGLNLFTTKLADDQGDDYPQAGGHGYSANTHFRFSTWLSPEGYELPVENVRRVETELPPGFVVNPQAPQEMCTMRRVAQVTCTPASIVGWADFKIKVATSALNWAPSAPVYNIKPRKGVAGALAFAVIGTPVVIEAELRSDSDYGITAIVPNNVSDPPVNEFALTLCGSEVGFDGFLFSPTNVRCEPGDGPAAYRGPLLTNPSSLCPAAPPTTKMVVSSWENPTVKKTYFADSPPITGCDLLTFEPEAAIGPTATEPDSPTGLDVDLDFPQEDNEYDLAPPALKKAVVTLPEGMSINPSAADGLGACTDEQLRLKSKQPVRCPDSSKIGTVTAKSPLLEEEVSGGVFIRSQNSDDPESGEMFRLALVLENAERGISVRLPGSVRADKDTGRLVTTFDNNPELPVSEIDLQLKSGPRAPLATPADCGEKAIDIELSSWGGQTVTRQSTFTVDCPEGSGGFAPSFTAGSLVPTAGAFSPFLVRIERPDGQQNLEQLSIDMPKGLLAKIAGVPLCGDGDANAGTCGEDSRVGAATVGAGTGSNPYYLSGGAYLTGPYKGAPYGLAVSVRVVAGPFDLGTVVVRQALHVDRSTAQVKVVSDALPTIVKGVPARLRSVSADIDRPGFTRNGTSCVAQQVQASLGSQQGSTHVTSSRYQAGNCAALPFEPKLAMSLTGKKQVTTGKHPGVRAQVNQAGLGEAGIKKAVVRLPKSLALDPENAQALCEFEDGTKPDLENHCPAGSIVGRARATTPLLERDLVGNVYFVKNVRKDPMTGNLIRTLPMIVVALRGEIAINLKGESSTTKGGKLVNTFNDVPDAPISQFNLNIAGGKNGILAVTRTRKSKINVCASRQLAEADIDGHNRRTHDFNTRIKTPCAKSAKKTKKAGGKSRNR